MDDVPRRQDPVDAEQLKAAIRALEAQRGLLGDVVVDLAQAPLIERLGALAAPAELRLRQITVLFADIVGSTALGVQLDPEDVASVVGLALERFGQVVTAHGGRVLRYTGDGLKGVFGVDGHADDGPAAAVRAALGMTEAARALAPVFREAYGLDAFRIRVGVNTGMAAIGAGIEAGNTAMGTTVNLASRFEQAAPPGTVLIGQDTQRHVRDRFDLIEQAPIHVKGHEAALNTWIVQGERTRSFVALTRGRADSRHALVGREAPLRQLLDAARTARVERRPVMVTLVGEAGIGKSRLLRELLARLGSSRPMLASAYAFNRLVPYAVLRDLLSTAFDIAETDDAATVQAKLVHGFGTSVGAEAVDSIGALVGFDIGTDQDPTRTQPDARGLRDAALRSLSEWLAQRGRDGAPLVLVVDDLHWADDASIDWVDQLATSLAGAPVLMVVTARPALLEARPSYGERHVRIDLAPLGREEGIALAEALLVRLATVPTSLRDRLTRDGNGNPFYMEELLRMLIDDGAIAVEADEQGVETWRVIGDRIDTQTVPPTLTGLLQARLDALRSHDRLALQQASVIGAVFWDATLDAMSPAARASLDELIRRDLIQRHRTSAFGNAVEYGFAHPLLHQVAYDTVLKTDRRTGHARVAAWLSARQVDRGNEHMASIAEHYARAGDHVNGADHFMRAARDATRRYANEAAMAHAERALELLGSDDHEQRIEMHGLRWSVSDLLGQRDVRRADLEQLSLHADASGSIKHRANAAILRAMHAERSSEFDDSMVQARQAAELGEAAGDWRTAALGWGQTAWNHARRAEHAAARAACEKALAFAQQSGDQLIKAQTLAVFAEIETSTGDLHRVIALRRQAIESVRGSVKGARLEAIAQTGVAAMLFELGNPDEAAASHREGLRIARVIGLRSTEAFALGELSRIALEAGRGAEALDFIERSLVISEPGGDRYRGAMSRLLLADALAAVDRHDDADRVLHEAIALFEAAGLDKNVVETRLRLAEASLAVGDVSAALDLASTALGQPQFVDDANDPLRARRILYQICTAVGDSRAAGWLGAARVQVEAMLLKMPDAEARARYAARPPIAWVLATDAALSDARSRAGR